MPACRSLCGSVDWNITLVSVSDCFSSRSLCGSVDWNRNPYCSIFPACYVAPFVGVWIEISLTRNDSCFGLGRSLCGSVDWNIWWNTSLNCSICRSLCGSVDWNDNLLLVWSAVFGRSLCGSVDWNPSDIVANKKEYQSLPLWECGLKLPYTYTISATLWSLPLWECGLKFYQLGLLRYLFRRSLCGSVDWNCKYEVMQGVEGQSLPLWECGLKLIGHKYILTYYGRSLCGSVDWNCKYEVMQGVEGRRSLCGSVDWNMKNTSV